ncbi:MAG: hypothetical protein M0Z46_01715, partial [Actinomycetota bacterium]|nr:hypothetical protein [Actinomycetota bacterium]
MSSASIIWCITTSPAADANASPVYHWKERRVRGHIALSVLAATIEAVMTKDLATAGVMDPDLDGQVLSARRALAELNRIR